MAQYASYSGYGGGSGGGGGSGITALTGDVSASGSGSVVATIQPGAVTLAKMANLPANTIIGNNTGVSAVPLALTATQVTALLNVFSSSLQGLVPASGGGSVNFLRADGTFAAPAGTGANTALSNLASVAINTALLPGVTNSINLGSSSFAWANGFFAGTVRLPTAFFINSATQNLIKIDSEIQTTPSGAVLACIYQPNGPSGTAASRDIAFFTQSGTSASPTGTIRIETGNNAGAGNSGDISIVTGTSAGTRGVISLSGASINANTSKITNVVDPTNAQEAATKNYVDTHAGTGITSLTGDVVASGPGAAAATIQSNVVSNTKLAQMPLNTIKGNNTGGTANAADLTVAQVTALIGVTSGSTALSLVERDANALISSVAFVKGYSTTVTAAGTTTLTVASNQDQYFTGATTQTVVLPAANTLVLGQEFTIVNNSSGAVTVNANGGGLVQLLATLTRATVVVTNVGSGAGVWDVNYSAGGGSGVTTVGAFSGSSIANGASISTSTITFGPADATNPGMVTTGTQTIAGAKTFNNALTLVQVATPSSPAASAQSLYVKSDGNLYLLNSSGVETLVGPGMSGTNWSSSLTWTLNNVGTTTSQNIFYRRVGDTMEVVGSATLGTTAAAAASISIAGGFTIDSAKLPSNASGTGVGYVTDLGGAGGQLFTSSITAHVFYDGSDTAKVYIGYTSSATTYTKNNGNTLWNTGDQISFRFTIPISGWTVSNGAPLTQSYPVRTITANASLLTTDNYILVNGAGTIAVTLPAASAGQVYNIKNITTFTTTITPTSGTIDGSASITLPVQNSSVGLISNGTNWFVV